MYLITSMHLSCYDFIMIIYLLDHAIEQANNDSATLPQDISHATTIYISPKFKQL